MNFNAEKLENAIRYRFKNRDLLREALTHPSSSDEGDNERLEFLGDSVLELCVSIYLFEKYPDAQEGELTKRRSAMVCSRSLMRAAKKIGLGEYILLGKGEVLAGGRNKRSVLENAMEALLGAIFLDGGLQPAQEAAGELIAKEFESECLADNNPKNEKSVIGRDYKSFLQETVQAGGGENIIYETEHTEGPPHDTVFYMRVTVGDKQVSGGYGKSKKEAEQKAAKRALEEIYRIKF